MSLIVAVVSVVILLALIIGKVAGRRMEPTEAKYTILPFECFAHRQRFATAEHLVAHNRMHHPAPTFEPDAGLNYNVRKL